MEQRSKSILRGAIGLAPFIILIGIVTTSKVAPQRQLALVEEFLWFERWRIGSFAVALTVLMFAYYLAFGRRADRACGKLAAYVASKPFTFWGAYFSIVLLIALPYLHARYRIFSEVAFQENAMRALERSNFFEAQRICRKYQYLFPQRKAGGSFPDPLCVPIVEYYQMIEKTRDYLSSLPSERGNFEAKEVPIDWNAKRFSLTLLNGLLDERGFDKAKLSGGKIVKFEDAVPSWYAPEEPNKASVAARPSGLAGFQPRRNFPAFMV